MMTTADANLWGLVKVLSNMALDHETRLLNMENSMTGAMDQIHQFRMAFDSATTDIANKIQSLTDRLNSAITNNDKVTAQQVMDEFQPTLNTLKAMGTGSTSDPVTGPSGTNPVDTSTTGTTSTTTTTGPTDAGATSNPVTSTAGTTLPDGTTPTS